MSTSQDTESAPIPSPPTAESSNSRPKRDLKKVAGASSMSDKNTADALSAAAADSQLLDSQMNEIGSIISKMRLNVKTEQRASTRTTHLQHGLQISSNT